MSSMNVALGGAVVFQTTKKLPAAKASLKNF